MIPPEMDRWAAAMRSLRPDWRMDSLRTFAANHLADRPYRDACVAGAWVATDPDARTPHLLTLDGPWWMACQPIAPPPPTEPGIVTWCEHGRPGALHCPDCQPKVDKPDASTIAEIRRAARDAP